MDEGPGGRNASENQKRLLQHWRPSWKLQQFKVNTQERNTSSQPPVSSYLDTFYVSEVHLQDDHRKANTGTTTCAPHIYFPRPNGVYTQWMMIVGGEQGQSTGPRTQEKCFRNGSTAMGLERTEQQCCTPAKAALCKCAVRAAETSFVVLFN